MAGSRRREADHGLAVAAAEQEDEPFQVDPTSTGQFFGLAGSGTDQVNVAGAHAAGSYSGTLG